MHSFCRTSRAVSDRNRRAFAAVYGFFIITCLFSFASFAVDWGRVQLVQTELERAADAGARAGASQLANGPSAVESTVVTFAARNLADASNVVIDPAQDIEFGTWDNSAKTFAVLTGAARTSANAVRVIARRTAARGNAVPLVFGAAVGMNSFDVQASSIVYVGATKLDYSAGFSGVTSLSLNGNAVLNGSNLRLTTTTANQASSAWNTSRVPVGTFTTSFNFLVTSPVADGFVFAIQNNSAAARQGSGGGLAYSGMGNSIAVKFDIYSNAGEGNSSTGLFTGGAAPQGTGSVNTTGAGVNLRSGQPMNCSMTYDGTTLTQTITNLTTNAVFSTSYTVNIPALVGGNTAWVGFTGSTGGSTAEQSITNWTYTGTGGVTLVR